MTYYQLYLRAASFLLAALALLPRPASACTVFTIVVGERVLFCDNEDFSNPRTRIWFVPAATPLCAGLSTPHRASTAGLPSAPHNSHLPPPDPAPPTKYGCVYLGFDDGWGQNGTNEKGLAYGWVAGFNEKWERQPAMKPFDGKPCHRMLESCATVEEAVAFFENNWEESFAYGRLLVADRTGKSVILRAKDGKLHAPIVTRSQGMGDRFGLRGNEATPLLAQIENPSLEAAARLLEFTRQQGINATKYSVAADLNTRDLWLYRFPEEPTPIHFNLQRELEKPAHFYDIPELPQQLNEDLRPLTDEMKAY